MYTRARKHNSPATKAAAAEQTRALLLQGAFREVYKSGFQSADLDAVLRHAGVTKGALYYHFPSKKVLGHAVVTDVVATIMHEKWLRPLAAADDPIAALVGIIEATMAKPEDLHGGCPLNNLAQEMSGLDESFRKKLARIFDDWMTGIAEALRRGQSHNSVRKDIDPVDAAAFLVATYEGYVSLVKNSRSAATLKSGKRHLLRYLDSMRAPKPA